MAPRLARLLPLAFSSLVLGASPALAQARGDAAALHWLAGCWERRAGTLLVEEQWLAPRAGTLFGVSRTTRGDSLVEYEFLRIEGRGDALVLAAHPSGQPAAEFVAIRVAAGEAVFENAAHDFPQRVRYRAVGADSLHARIEGVQGGRARGVDFPYVRVGCAAGARAR